MGIGLCPLGTEAAPFGRRRRLGGFADAEPEAVTEAEAAAQEELRQIVEELDEICSRLADVNQRLPVSPQETAMLLGKEEMDVATHVRSVIECLLMDNLWSAVRDLAAAASHRPRRSKEP